MISAQVVKLLCEMVAILLTIFLEIKRSPIILIICTAWNEIAQEGYMSAHFLNMLALWVTINKV